MSGVVEVHVSGIAKGGAGVGRLPDGRAVFVHRAAPGDVVQVALTTEKARWARGTLQSVESPGPSRETPRCTLYDRCGGCTLQHVSYDEQLRWKARIVEDALRRIGGIDVPVETARPSPEEVRYRMRMTFTLRRLRGGRVIAGLHDVRTPHRVVDVRDECWLPTEALMTAWSALRSGWGVGARRLPAGPELRLTLREVDEGVVLIVGGGIGTGDPEALVREIPSLVAVWRSGSRGPAQLVAGTPETHETRLGTRLRVASSSFSQVNAAVGDMIHTRVVELAGRWPGPVVDAYSGGGALGRALASAGRRVVAIEVDPDALAVARTDTPDRMDVLEGRVEDRLGEALPVGVAIVNPPRTGLHAAVPEILAESPPDAVLYLSCDPATLARDARRLSEAFDVATVEAFDLFPQTAHVEALSVFVRRTTA